MADKQDIPPLSVMTTAANTHDMKAATTETLDCIVTKDIVQRKRNNNDNKIYACLDKGYKPPQILISIGV